MATAMVIKLSSWKQSLKTRRAKLAMAGLGGVGLTLYALSPYLAVWDFGSAIASRNAEKVSSYIDFMSLRESLKVEGLKIVASNMNENPDLQANPLKGLAYVMAGPIVNIVINNYVTPSGLKALLEKDSAATRRATKQERTVLEKINTFKVALEKNKLGYKSLNTFDVTSTDKFNRKLTLTFKREGIASWRLAEVELPPDGHFSP